MATVQIQSIECVKKTGDPGDNDEVYINLETEGLTGKLPDDKDYWELSDLQIQEIDRTYDFNRTFTLTVMESDTGSDDQIGTYTFDSSKTPPSSPLHFTGEEGDEWDYKLNFTYSA